MALAEKGKKQLAGSFRLNLKPKMKHVSFLPRLNLVLNILKNLLITVQKIRIFTSLKLIHEQKDLSMCEVTSSKNCLN